MGVGDGTGVAVGTAVAVGVGTGVGASVGVGVGTGVGAGVIVGAGVNVGAAVGVGTGEGVEVNVRVGTAVGVGVNVGTGVGMEVGDGAGVAIGIGVGVGVIVGASVNVGARVGEGIGDGVLTEDSRGRTVAATPLEISSCTDTFDMTSFWSVCSVSFTDCDGVGVSTQEAANSRTIIRRSAMCAICPHVCALRRCYGWMASKHSSSCSRIVALGPISSDYNQPEYPDSLRHLR